MDKHRYQVQFEKDKGYLKAFLQGRNYHVALKALGFIERETAGKFRKDGVMPEMHHMVRLALDATQLGLPFQQGPEAANGKYSMSIEERLITVLLFHDVIEDDKSGKIDQNTIQNLSRYYIADSVWLMTKKFRGEKKDKKEYITELGENLISALGKGIDRNDNLEHMLGVFDLPKIIDYVHEAETEHYPMLKRASKLFPEHMREFQVVMYRMKRNIKFLKQYITAMQEPVQPVSNIDEDYVLGIQARLDQVEKDYAELQAKPVPTGLTATDAIKKVMKLFDNVSPAHQYVLQQKLCVEFGVSFLEMQKINSIAVDVDGHPPQTTTLGVKSGSPLADNYRN